MVLKWRDIYIKNMIGVTHGRSCNAGSLKMEVFYLQLDHYVGYMYVVLIGSKCMYLFSNGL